MDQPRGDIIKNALYSASLCLLHSRKFFFFAHPLEDFYIVHGHIHTSFLFLLQKDFATFHKPVLKVFLYLFNNILLKFLYIEKKNRKKYFILSVFFALKIDFPI